MEYTLQDYFYAAKLRNPVAFAKYITLANTPWQKQVEGLNRLLTSDRYGLLGQPATGKTLMAQAACLYWISEGYRCVCVMPPILLYQFEEEFRNVFCGVERYVTTHIFDDPPAKRRAQKEAWNASGKPPEVLILSYQMFAIEYEWIRSANYRVLVCDEAQEIKNSQSKTYALVKDFAEQKDGAALILMTGTPIHNEMIDAYSFISLLAPDAYSSFRHFDVTHSVYRKVRLKTPKLTKTGKKIHSFRQRIGYQKVERIREALYRNASRVLKKDVFELTDPSIIEVPVKLEPGHLALYRKLVKERILQKKDEMIIAINAQALRQKALQIVTCPELFIDNDKLDFRNNIVEAIRTLIAGMGIRESKVLVFANYQNSIRTLEGYFKEHNPALMYGDSDSGRGRAKFLSDDSCRMLIANPKSAGVGLNLQHICHTVIFAEPTGVPGDFQQAMDRVVRHGQKNLVNVYILKALGTISPKATKEMLRKEGQAQQVHRDWYSFAKDFMAA